MVMIITNAGENKDRAVELYREYAGVDIADAKATIENISIQTPLVIETEDEDEIFAAFQAIGADVQIDHGSKNVPISLKKTDYCDPESSSAITSSVTSDITDVCFKGISEDNLIDLSDLSNYNRDQTLSLLITAQTIITEIYNKQYEIDSASEEVSKHRQKVEDILNHSDYNVWIPIGVGAGGFVFGEIVSGTFLGIIFAVVAFYIVARTMHKNYLNAHKEENQRKADEYSREYLEPAVQLEERLKAELSNMLGSVYWSWLVDLLPDNMIQLGIVNELVDLVKKRRADSFKEALNLYETIQHENRMEEMQARQANAAEVAATESIKQTAAAAVTAYNTYQTAKNTKQISKNIRRK